MYKFIFAVLAGLASHTLMAAPEALLAGDPEAGKSLTMVCQACHGAEGISPSDAFPSIAGQNAKYLVKQLHDIRSGARSVPMMAGMLDNMSDEDMADVAAYYAVQTPQNGAADPELVDLGRNIYRAGIPRKGIAACTACHSPQGQGNNFAKFPMLAGQWPAYTVQQLKAFRTGERSNDGDGRMMRTVAMDMSDEEIEAVASYIYGLR